MDVFIIVNISSFFSEKCFIFSDSKKSVIVLSVISSFVFVIELNISSVLSKSNKLLRVFSFKTLFIDDFELNIYSVFSVKSVI